MATGTDKPTKPFEWRMAGADPMAGKPGVAQFALPFDEEWRATEKPNVEERVLPALVSIGHAVVSSPERYCPAYRIVRVVNVRTMNSEAMRTLEAQGDDHIVIIDRRTAQITHIDPSYSPREAAISWFVRTPGNDDAVLCLDRQEGHYYVEPKRVELTAAIAADGTEVATDEEHVSTTYRIDQHPNAIMVHGE